MWTYNYSTELYHHGIKGQRWGIRRFQRKDGSLTPAGKKRSRQVEEIHPDYERAHSKRNLKSMSDSELQKVNNRLNMERNYMQMISSQTTKKGKNAAKKVLAGAGAIVGVAVLAAVKQGVKDGAKKAITPKVADISAKSFTKAMDIGKAVVEGIKHSDSYSDELYHYGVKGMKWGVRRQEKRAARQKKKADEKTAMGTIQRTFF